MRTAVIHDAGFLIGPSRWGTSAGLRVTLSLARTQGDDARALVAGVPELSASPALRRAPSLPAALVALADAMRGAAGIPGGQSAHGSTPDGETWLLLAAPRAQIGAVLSRGLEAVLRALPGPPGDAITATLRALVDAWDNPIESGRVAAAAHAEGIPARFLDGDGGSLVLGLGARRRIYHMHALGDANGLDAVVDDKIATATLLAQAGIACTRPVRVATARDAVRAARAIGYPVVLKPNMGWQQVGVFTGLTSDDAVRRAFRASCRQAGPLGRDLLVEGHREGRYVRATIIGGALQSVAAATTPRATGDGKRTAEDLARRAMGMRDGERLPARGVGILAAALGAEGLTRASVPRRGRRFAIGLSSHGAFTNFTDTVDPTLRAVLLRVAALFPLPAVGIDLLMRDPRRLDTRSDVVLEVNTRPMLYLGGPTRDVAAALVRHFYPRGARDAKVPVVIAPPGGDRAIVALGRTLAGAGMRTAGYASRALWWGDPSRVIGEGPAASQLVGLDPFAEALLVALDDDVLSGIGLGLPEADHVLSAGAWPDGLSARRFAAPRARASRSPADVAARILRARGR